MNSVAIVIIPQSTRHTHTHAPTMLATVCLTFTFYGFYIHMSHDSKIIPAERSIAGDLPCFMLPLAHLVPIIYVPSFTHSSRLFLSLLFLRTSAYDFQAMPYALHTYRSAKVFTTTETPTTTATATHTHAHTHIYYSIKTNLFCSFGLASVRWFFRFFFSFLYSSYSFVFSDVKRIGSLCIYIRCTISDIVTHSVSRA